MAHLPRGQIRTILDKAATAEERDWYAAAAVQYGWSRNVLLNMMMNRSMERTGTAPSNFTRQLAAPDSELAQQMAKDPVALLGTVAWINGPHADAVRASIAAHDPANPRAPGARFPARNPHPGFSNLRQVRETAKLLHSLPSGACPDAYGHQRGA